MEQECIYINEYCSIRELRVLISEWVAFYNNTRIHESLGYKTPASRCFGENDVEGSKVA